MSKKYVYKEREASEVLAGAQSGGDFDTWLKRGAKTFKPQPGKNKIRLLPPTWDDRSHYGLDVWFNYQVGPDKGTYLSLNKMKGIADPIYEEYVKAKNDGRDEDAKLLSAKKRVLAYVIDRKHENDGPLLWAMPVSVDKTIRLTSVDQDTMEALAVDKPEEGYDITFTKTGAEMQTKYEGITISRRATPLSDNDDEFEAWLDFVVENPIPEQLNFYSYEHIKAAFTGEVEATASNKKLIDDSDDDDADVDEEDDAEDELKARKRGNTKSIKQEEHLDDPVDDDDEEPDEDGVLPDKPKRSSLADRLAARRARSA